MTYAQAMSALEKEGDPKVKQLSVRTGVENQFGVPLGKIRDIAKEIKSDHALGLELWTSGNLDAMLLGILVMKPKQLAVAELDQMVRRVSSVQLADWFSSYILKVHPQKEELRERWMASSDPFTSRLGWSLMHNRISKAPDKVDLGALLDRLEKEMPAAPEEAQWTMNFCLGTIGIDHPDHRARVLELGERIGAFKDYPTSKGCTSPYVPIWVNEMVSRKATS